MAVEATLRQRGPRGPLELPSADRRPLMDDAAFEEMEELRELCLAPFDADDPHHLAMLETLWRSALPDKPFERLSRHWADTFGFQGRDPATDVRGGGFVALQHLWRFAATSPTHPGALVRSGFPLAIASINATAMLQSYLGLNPDVVVPALAGAKAPPEVRLSFARCAAASGGRAALAALHAALLHHLVDAWARLELRTTARRLTVMDYPPLAAAAAAHLQRALFFSPAPWDLARVGAALRAPSQPPWALPPADLCCASPIAMTMAFLLLLAQSLSGRRG